jgi:hypothetical protein
MSAEPPDGGSADAGRDDAGLPDAGPLAPSAPLERSLAGLFVAVRIDGQGPVIMRYDTGSPDCFIGPIAAGQLGLTGGTHQLAFGAVDVGMQALPVIHTSDEGVTYPGISGPVAGTLGNSAFNGRRVALDFASNVITVAKPTERIVVPADALAPRAAGFAPLAGYLKMSFAFGSAPAVDCVFDTGSLDSLVLGPYWSTVPERGGAQVPEDSFDSQGHPLICDYERGPDLRLGADGGFTFARRPWLSVCPSFDLLDAVGLQIGARLKGIVGLVDMLPDFVVIDYAANQVTFWPRGDSGYLAQDPLVQTFVGYGFTLGDALDVTNVVARSQAEDAGVRVGDVLTSVSRGGQALTDLVFSIAATIEAPLGEPRKFDFTRDGGTVSFVLTSENLLP